MVSPEIKQITDHYHYYNHPTGSVASDAELRDISVVRRRSFCVGGTGGVHTHITDPVCLRRSSAEGLTGSVTLPVDAGPRGD
jgi:hypothetical protein